MRINVYAEELTSEVQLIEKSVEDEEFGKRTFVGVRVFFKSPPELHQSPEDDDRTAITFWYRKDSEEQKKTVATMLASMYGWVEG